MLRLFILGIAGAAGGISRYLLGGLVHQFAGIGFPFGTLTVNIAGCLAIGFLGTLAEEKFVMGPLVRMGLFMGFLGAFTTFSSFAYETWELFKDSEYLLAFLNVIGSIVGCFLGLLFGVFLGRAL